MAWWDGKACADDVCIPASLQNSVASLYEQAYECVHGTTTTWPRYNSGQCVPASDINALRSAIAALIAQALALGRMCECAWDELNDSGYDPTDDCENSTGVSAGDLACICDYRCIERALECFLNWEDGACCNCCAACQADFELVWDEYSFEIANPETVWTVASGTYDTAEEACTACGDPSDVYSFEWDGTTYFCCDLSTVTWDLLWEQTTPYGGNDRTCRMVASGLVSDSTTLLQLQCEEEAFPSTVHDCAEYSVKAPNPSLTTVPCECCDDFEFDPYEPGWWWEPVNGAIDPWDLDEVCIECAPADLEDWTSCIPLHAEYTPTAWFGCVGETPLIQFRYRDPLSGCVAITDGPVPATSTGVVGELRDENGAYCADITLPDPWETCNPEPVPEQCGPYIWYVCTHADPDAVECGDTVPWVDPPSVVRDTFSISTGTTCADLSMTPDQWYLVRDFADEDTFQPSDFASFLVCAVLCQDQDDYNEPAPPTAATILQLTHFWTGTPSAGFGLRAESTYDCYDQDHTLTDLDLVYDPSAHDWTIYTDVEELECVYTKVFASALATIACDYDLDECDCASGTEWEIEVEIDYDNTDGCPEITIAWKHSAGTPTELGETGAPCTMSGYPTKDDWYIHTFDTASITCRMCREDALTPANPNINTVLTSMTQNNGGTIFPHPDFGLRLYAYALCPDWGGALFDGADIYVELDDTGWTVDPNPSPLPDTCRFILDSSDPQPVDIPCDWNVNECDCMPSSSSSSSSTNGGA